MPWKRAFCSSSMASGLPRRWFITVLPASSKAMIAFSRMTLAVRSG
jgi:hypothetical protein